MSFVWIVIVILFVVWFLGKDTIASSFKSLTKIGEPMTNYFDGSIQQEKNLAKLSNRKTENIALRNRNHADEQGEIMLADNHQYHTQEGFKGGEFADYIRDQTIDPKSLENHAEYTKNIVDKKLTGRAFVHDGHEGYTSTPWIGVRGPPQRVPINNPTQIIDVDLEAFPIKRVNW